MSLFDRFRKKKPEQGGAAPQESEAGTIEKIDITEMVDAGARKWMEEHAKRPSPTPEELSRLKTRYDDLRKMLQSDSGNQETWTELGAICVELQKFPEAQDALRRALSMDPAFESFDQIDTQVRQAARQRGSFDLATSTRRAMCYLGFLCERTGKHRLAEDYVLNALYDCHDAQLQVLAGRFYLESSGPEVETAIAYFKQAIEISPACVAECDKLVEWFVATRKHLYPRASWAMIEEYMKIWESLKKGT